MTRKYAPTWKHHIERYAFALPYCYRRDVMDAGSQTGFGANLLSHVAKSVDCVDISEYWLNLANDLYQPHCEMRYLKCDFEKEFPEGSWDTIVAFEVIEHLEFPDVFLENVSKSLNKNGSLVFSVPHMVANHEHKHLYDEEKIKELVGRYLNIKEFYVQDSAAIDKKPLYKGLKCYVGVGVKK